MSLTPSNTTDSIDSQQQLFDSMFLECPSQQMSTSNGAGPEAIEIDVKPKRRFFSTKEEKRQFTAEYKKKLKTELCKTFTLKGSCKFGEHCSFAHGKGELKSKIHLSSNYKTKPCKQYFQLGFCSYGHRCQYLHNEIQYDQEKVFQFYEFLVSAYIHKQVSINFLTKSQYSHSIRLKKMENMFHDAENYEDLALSMLNLRTSNELWKKKSSSFF